MKAQCMNGNGFSCKNRSINGSEFDSSKPDGSGNDAVYGCMK